MTIAIIPYDAILSARVRNKSRKSFFLIPSSMAMGVCVMENRNGIINLNYKSVIINHPKLFDCC